MALVGRIPGKTGLTREAAEALANQSNPIVTDLDDESGNESQSPEYPFDVPIGPPLFDEHETGDGVDDSKLRQKSESPPPPREAKPGVPSLDEWMDFFSRIVLRVACDWYIEWAFRGVDENSLTDREIERIQLTVEERQRIAVPLSELSHKSKFMRKHGRTIVASGGAFDAIVALGTWTSRVNRIARKHKPHTLKGKVVTDERTRQGESPEASGYSGANGGRIVDGVTIINPGG
jgi:hypothetical protein